MKKNVRQRALGLLFPGVGKILKMMKLTLCLIFFSIFGAIASETYSQTTKLSVHLTNMSVKDVLKEIEDKSDFFFLYSEKLIDVNRKVTIDVHDEHIDRLLGKLFENAGVVYTLKGRQIVLSPSSGSPALMKGQNEQSLTVRGKVTDSSGAPLPGVTVMEKGTLKGTVTAGDGSYQLQGIAGDAALMFSFVGMKTLEVRVQGLTEINVSLEDETIGIEEVVAIGYGTMRKSDLTGSVSQVKSEVINAFPTTNVMQALSGKSSGVQVMQNTGAPGATMSIRIRGGNSIKGSNEPLYVIDGFPVNNQTMLNNSDIESIEILKDASATAIYGSRGANGVVLITTKRGKEGKTSVDFETSYSSQSLIKKLDLMNAREYAALYNIQQLNDAKKEYFTQDQINSLGEGTDWQDVVFRTAPMLTTSLNISGGNQKTRFAISGSTFNQSGIIEGSNYNRYSIRTNVDHDFSRFFRAVLSGTFSRLDTDRKDSSGGARGNSLIGATLGAPPTVSPYTEDGKYTVLNTTYPFMATDIINPLNFIKEHSETVRANVALINAALEFKPVEEITLRISGGIENRDDRTDNYKTTNFFKSDGSASVSSGQYTSLLSENTISYNDTFRDRHHVSAVAGFTYQDFLSTSLGGSGTGFLSDNFETYNLGSADVPGIPSSGYSKSVILSYLGRVNYNFDNKYYATVSFRADGASKFSEGNKWGYFPSAALSWRISDENFMKNLPVISNLKLRTSWGTTGSQAIGAYATLSELSSGKVVFGDELYTTFSPDTQLPGDLKWETTEQFDAGFELALWENRININADYYVKNTKDLLNTVTLPSSMGYTNVIQNVGKVRNKGFELNLGAKPLTGAFKWDLDINLSANRNKVVKLYNGDDILGGYVSVVAIQDNINILREGQPIGRFYGYLEDGYDEKGHIKYQDLKEDGSINSADKTYIGDPNPDFIYGVNSGMSYKNFQLDIFLQGSQGNDLFNVSAVAYAADYGYGMNMLREVLYDHWSADNPNAKYPVISQNSTVNVSDRFVEDGSYLRLKNIQLAYTFSGNMLKADWFRSLQLYMSAQNLLTWTNYSGWDPEVNSMGGATSTTPGVDNKVYPMSKTFTFGIRASF